MPRHHTATKLLNSLSSKSKVAKLVAAPKACIPS